MQSILSYGLLAGLGSELILAFGLIVFIMKKPKIPCQKESLPLPVCQSDKCKQLETLMLDYMKTKLDFSDTSEELEAVKKHLKEQQEEIHNQGSEEARRRSLIDTYIFEFWTIQLKILLVPGRCRVPIDYTFMPHDVENLLSI